MMGVNVSFHPLERLSMEGRVNLKHDVLATNNEIFGGNGGKAQLMNSWCLLKFQKKNNIALSGIIQRLNQYTPDCSN